LNIAVFDISFLSGPLCMPGNKFIISIWCFHFIIFVILFSLLYCTGLYQLMVLVTSFKYFKIKKTVGPETEFHWLLFICLRSDWIIICVAHASINMTRVFPRYLI
jgi:hypothetical protein